MIIKKSVMRNKGISKYSGLAEYIMNEQTAGKIRNAAMWTSSSFDNDDIDLFIKDVETVQKNNTLSNDDKTYHLIVSFKEDDIDLEKLRKIENDIVEAMGFEKHQRLCVVHNDTDNLHFHIAINKINPETNKIYTPYRDYQKLNDISVAIENKYGLIKDNHIRSEKPYSKAIDIEKSGYMQSLQSYIRNINLDNIFGWEEFHNKLNEHGIKYIKRGAGAVFTSEDMAIYIKASNIDKSYSINKLEEKLGDFIPGQYKNNLTKEKYEKKAVNDNGIYDDYKQYNETRSLYLKEEIKKINDECDRKLDSDLYGIKKVLNKTLLKEASYMERFVINKVFSRRMKARKEAIIKEKQNKKAKLYENNPYMKFDEWVKKEALAGNNKAREYIETQISKDNYIIADFSSQMKDVIKVTKNGTYITSDNMRIRNNALNIRSEKEYPVLKYLEYYQKLHPDKPLEIAGTDTFKKQVINVIVKYQLNISMKDEQYQAQLQTALQNKKQEESSILNEFNTERNDKMFKYKHIDFKEDEYEYRGFVKHKDTYFMVVKSNNDNTFYVKEPTKEDYKKVKGLEKGSSISFEDKTPNNNLILDDYIDEKERTKLQYEPLNKDIDTEKLHFQGVRKYQDKLIYLYEDNENHRIYTKIATKKDLEQFREQNRADKQEKAEEKKKNQDFTR